MHGGAGNVKNQAFDERFSLLSKGRKTLKFYWLLQSTKPNRLPALIPLRTLALHYAIGSSIRSP